MLLVIHNLPSYTRYTDVKSLILSKCGVTEIILDNLKPDKGDKKKVTVGLADEADAGIIVRKLNGYFLDGDQLYVEDVRQKKEQPYRPSQALTAEMSNKSFPGYQEQQQQNYGTEDANAMAMNMMMYNNMAMGGMYYNYNYMDAAGNVQNPYMNYGQQAVPEQPVSAIGYMTQNNASTNVEKQPYLGSNPTSQKWDNQTNSNTGYDSRLPYFAQSTAVGKQASMTSAQTQLQRGNDRSNRNSGGYPSSGSDRPSQSQPQSRDYDRNNRGSPSNYERRPNPNSFDLEPRRNNTSRFDNNPQKSTNPNSFDIEPRRRETSYSYPDRNNPGSHTSDQRRGFSSKRPADADQSASQAKRLAAYPDRNSYPQNNFDNYQGTSSSQDYQRKRDAEPTYNRFDAPRASDRQFNQPPARQGPPYGSTNNSAPPRRPNPYVTTPATSNKQIKKKDMTNDPIRAMNKSTTWRAQIASTIGKEIMTKMNLKNVGMKEKVFTKLKECIRTRLNVMLGDRLDTPMSEMNVIYRQKYHPKTDYPFFVQVVEMVKKEHAEELKLKELNKGNEDPSAPVAKSNINPGIQNPASASQNVPKPKEFPPKNTQAGQKSIDQPGPNPGTQSGSKFSAQTAKTGGKGPKFNIKKEKSSKMGGQKFLAETFDDDHTLTPKMMRVASKKKAKMEQENPDMYVLKPLLQKYVYEHLDIINDIIQSVVQNPDNNQEKRICETIASDAAIEARGLIQLNLRKRLLNVTTGLMIAIFGKVKKQALVEFLEQYDVTNVNNSAKSGGMFVASCRTYRAYDELCALGTSFVDGNRITIKPLHISGPPSKMSKAQIAMDRQKYIKSQINPFQPKSEQNVNTDNTVETEEVITEKCKIKDEQSDTNTNNKTETVKNGQPSDNIEIKTDNNTQNIIDTKTNDNVELPSNDEKTDDQVSTNIEDKTDDQSNNEDVNDTDDVPNDENAENPEDFDVDNVELDEDDLEDY